MNKNKTLKRRQWQTSLCIVLLARKIHGYVHQVHDRFQKSNPTQGNFYPRQIHGGEIFIAVRYNS